MKRTIVLGLTLSVAALAAEAQDASPSLLAGEPYVYSQWESFYAADGLPNDHIFALRADGDRLWVGTEGGLALYEDGRWRSCFHGFRATATATGHRHHLIHAWRATFLFLRVEKLGEADPEFCKPD